MLFTRWWHFVHSLVTFCSLDGDILFTGWWHFVHSLVTFCSLAGDMFTRWWHFVHWLVTFCSLTGDILFTRWWHSLHSLLTFPLPTASPRSASQTAVCDRFDKQNDWLPGDIIRWGCCPRAYQQIPWRFPAAHPPHADLVWIRNITRIILSLKSVLLNSPTE